MPDPSPGRRLGWHRFRPRTAALPLQLLLWGLLAAFYFAWYNRPNHRFDGPIWSLVLLRLLYAVGLFNALVYLIIPRWLLRGRFGLALLGAVGLVLGFGAFNYYGYQLAAAHLSLSPDLADFYRRFYQPGLRAAVFSGPGLVSTLFDWQYATLFPLIVSFVAYAQVVDRRRLALERDRMNLELRYLKAQLNPQFLFNTLGNLHELTQRRDPRAGDVVLHLADLMRYTLYESDTDTVPLRRELEFLDDYLALEQLRARPGLVIEHATSGHATTQCLVPLLLFPFVERLFAGLPALPTLIKSTVDVGADGLHLTLTRTTAAPQLPAYRADAAVAAALRRLQQHYPGRHAVQLRENEAEVHLSLHLQLPT